MKKIRQVSVSSAEIDTWFAERMMYKPVSLAAQGVMSWIMRLCNRNYGINCCVNYKQLAGLANSTPKVIKENIKILASEGYIDVEEVDEKVCNIFIKILEEINKKLEINSEKITKKFSQSEGIVSFSGVKEKKSKEKENIIVKGNFKNVGQSESSISVGGNGKRISLADL